MRRGIGALASLPPYAQASPGPLSYPTSVPMHLLARGRIYKLV